MIRTFLVLVIVPMVLAQYGDVIMDQPHNFVFNYLAKLEMTDLIKLVNDFDIPERKSIFLQQFDPIEAHYFQLYLESPQFDENSIRTMLNLHNEAREKVSRGEFVDGNGQRLPAARNMETMKWNRAMVPITRAAAIKLCVGAGEQERRFNRFVVGDGSYAYHTHSELAEVAFQRWTNERFPESNVIITKELQEVWSMNIARVLWGSNGLIGCGVTNCVSNTHSAHHYAGPIVFCGYGQSFDDSLVGQSLYEVADNQK